MGGENHTCILADLRGKSDLAILGWGGGVNCTHQFEG